MIAWLHPAALAGLALLAGPILVHLLLRHRAKRVPFPSLRFVSRSRTAAIRFRPPSDLLLLLLRLGIVTLAVAALAQPILITASRTSSWNARIARVVVVDTSDSVSAGSSGAAAIAEAESHGAAFASRIDAAELRPGLRQGVAWLGSAPPARREIVVISDFQRGALTAGDLDLVPADIGVRLVQVGAGVLDRRVRGLQLFGAAGAQDVLLSQNSTAVIVTPGPPAAQGLRLLAADGEEAAAVRAIERAVAAAGAPAPSPRQPIAIAFAGAPRIEGVRAVADAWMLETVLRLEADRELAEACAAQGKQSRASGRKSEASERTSDPGSRVPDPEIWQVLCLDPRGGPLVRAAAAGPSLVLDVAAEPTAFLSAAVVRGALMARQGSSARPEDEIQRMTPAELTAWSRAIPPVAGDAWRHGQPADSRWCWAAVLALLAVETIVRRRGTAAERLASEVRADAA